MKDGCLWIAGIIGQAGVIPNLAWRIRRSPGAGKTRGDSRVSAGNDGFQKKGDNGDKRAGEAMIPIGWSRSVGLITG